MKNILIVGCGRSGKTTLSKMINDKYNNYNILHSDDLKWAMIRADNKENYYMEHVDKQNEFEMGYYFQKTQLEFFNLLIERDKNEYGYILESGQVYLPILSELVNFDNTNVICLGLGDYSAEQIVEQCLKYDTEESWSYGLDKDYLLRYAKKFSIENEIFKRECPKYGIEYIDTSKNREQVFKDILERIIN